MNRVDIHIRLGKALKDSIYKEAQKRDMSISSYVRYVLRKEVEK